MKFIGDYHTHSTYSDGRDTIVEMVDAARQKGLGEVAITDHGPRNIGVGVKGPGTFLVIKEEIEKLQDNREDIKILAGAEANIISSAGEIDIPVNIAKELDILLVGLHPYVWPNTFRDGISFVLGNQLSRAVPYLKKKMKNTNTKALVEAMHKYPVAAVTHPGLGMPIELDEVCRACLATDTAWEINTGHNFQTVNEVQKAARKGAKFIVNSDAHFAKTVGALEQGLSLLTHANVDLEQIINIQV
ncbi:MAG: PHP domain-containing protein [Desulfitobacteriaceae bacterium]|nr:PHP domain-containing protein [Desulfitobacteriaceae bacterium]MDD4753366.1 PHP domain-containing protein [Desulfitobacteriaceae bacterium]